MRWILTTLVLVAALTATLARHAAADPASEHLDGFIAKLETYAGQLDPDDPELKPIRKAVSKVQKLLQKKSASLATDATLAAKIAKLLAKGGPELEELATEVASAMGDIADNANGLIDNIRYRAEDLPDSKFKEKAQRSLAKIDAILADVDPDDLKALGKAIKRALVERRKAAKFVGKAEAQLDEV